MAKSKSSKSNTKALLDFVVLVLAGAIFGFLALPFVGGKIESVIGNSDTATTSGYGLLDFEANSGIATCILLTIIFASLLVCGAILKLLADAGVVKGASLAKVSGLVTVVFALAVLVMAIVVMIVIPSNCESFNIGGLVGAKNFAIWYALIINAVVSLGAFVASVFSIRK